MVADLFSGEKGTTLYNRVVSFVEKTGMDKLLRRGVLVGFSGGADSVFLLHFLKRYLGDFGTPITAVHINHMLRGDEAMRDEAFSRDKCEQLGVEFICRRIDVVTFARDLGLGVEECARNIRYSEFGKIISGRNDLFTVAVAHNATDNAETILLNMLRGAGSRGCAGIPPIRENVCRPVLCIPKREVVEALRDGGIEFVFDSSNASTDYSRNFVRHEILPKFSRLTNNPEQMLLRLSDNLRADDDFISSCASAFLCNGEVTVDKLSALHEAVFVRVLGLMCGVSYGLSASCIADIRKLLCRQNFTYCLPFGKKFIAEHGMCRVVDGDFKPKDYIAEFEDGKAVIDELNSLSFLSVKPFDNSYLNVYKKSIQANLGSAIINGRLYFRPKQDGDAVYYGSMTHKLKKLYNDRKIPPSQRDRIPVLCDDGGVVWVPGFGVRDDGGKGTKYVLLCSDSQDESCCFLSGFDFK